MEAIHRGEIVPDRTIRERARKSEKLAALSAEAERLWWRLVTMADDLGRIRDNTVLILSEAFPLMADRITTADIETWLGELATVKLIRRYRAEGQSVLWVVGWDRHQAIAYPNPSELPGLDREDRAPGKPGRLVSKPRRVEMDSTHARTPARAGAVSSVSSTGITGSNSNKSTGTVPVQNIQTQLPGITDTHHTDTEGGYGGKPRPPSAQLSRRRDTERFIAEPDVPIDLRDFDEIFRVAVQDRYHPTSRFFERIRTNYLGIAGLDLEYEAEGMVNWLRDNAKGRTYTDIPRFAENWLSRVVERLGSRPQAARRPYNGSNGNGSGNGKPYGMGGPISPEARESARRMTQRARELGDD